MYSTKKTVTFRKTKGIDLADQWMCALVHPLLKKLGLELVFQSVRPVNNLQYISKLVEKAVFQWKGTCTWSSMKSILICIRPIVNITALKRPCSKLWTTSSWKWTCNMRPWWSCWIEAQHLTQLIIIPCWSDSAGMLAYVGKCLTGSARICRIGASKSSSMGRLLDSSHLTVAYLRVLVWHPCCSSFTLPCCLRLSSITSRTFTVSRTITH